MRLAYSPACLVTFEIILVACPSSNAAQSTPLATSPDVPNRFNAAAQNIAYMNGAIGEPLVSAIKAANTIHTIRMGRSQYFFRARANNQNSVRKCNMGAPPSELLGHAAGSVPTFPGALIVAEKLLDHPTILWRIHPMQSWTIATLVFRAAERRSGPKKRP